MATIATIDELVRTGTLLSGDQDLRGIIARMVDQALDVSKSDLAVLYLYPDEDGKGALRSVYKRGRFAAPAQLSQESELVDFLEDSGEAVIVHERDCPFFAGIFLHEEMHSGIALPVSTPKAKIGVLILNARKPEYYGRNRLSYLDSFIRLAGSLLHNTELLRELREQLRQIEALERYQESIFSSMTNLLITTDENGNIHYFNDIAAERLGLTEDHIGTSYEDLFRPALGKRALNQIRKVEDSGLEIMGLEGIYRNDKVEIDYSMNISQLQGKRGRHEGLTFLLSDQTRERELRAQMQVAVEDRRVIKDMFARYMSQDVIQSLMDNPDQVNLGGDKRIATLFFADIRGYTSFSEGKEPEYIIEVLNEYFSQAVEVVIKHHGYIDKFIGDCIMAAWGVPMATEEQDAIAAVSTAVEIQQLVKSKDRTFFKGKASKLKVGIGMHTGPLVAGNLGSSRRMDYSVIGDTVNVAARLEGVAGAGDVIITEDTRERIGDNFKLKELEPVKVKGKVKPLHIFNVLDMAG